ncbi:MAG: polysaccharide biosynthesis protein [Gammaproteobacteria bacterium]|nr:polysaccharide biosynthesis protein [Gammaproteobacteria bacterium]
MMHRLLQRLRSRSVAVGHDLAMVPLAWMAAFWLRFNLESIPQPYLDQALSSLPLVAVVQGAVFWYFGLYRGVWRFASVPDLLRICKASVVGACAIGLLLFLLTRLEDVPRSVLPVYALLLVMMLGGPRLTYRWLKDRSLYVGGRSRALVIGAGPLGEGLVRELLRDPGHGLEPIGFVDDDYAKKGREIQGIRVLGGFDKIPRLNERLSIDLAIIAEPGLPPRTLRRLVGICERAGIPMQILPRGEDSRSAPRAGRGAAALRDIVIEDLLGREPVSLAWERMEGAIRDRTVLITGGGGSIGSELCRQILRLAPRRLVIVERSEFNLFRIEQELREALDASELAADRRPEIRPVLCDVCDSVAVQRTMRLCRPELVLHAAAFKHVPMLEAQAREAVRNNVLGTRTVAEAAARVGVRTFVLISTDKAVNPTSLMGASKRIAEILCQNMDSRVPDTRFITVRFGNVLDSAGSVVPIFRAQIARGGPVTVTHPEVKRYFMTIPEACELILQAGAVGEGGEIFVLDMGEPVAIDELARQMIRLSGRRPEQDVPIKYIGLRPGEKLFEELFHPSEALRPSGHAKLLLARYRPVDWGRYSELLTRLEARCESFDEEGVRALVAEMVPELATRPAPVHPQPTATIVPMERSQS